MANGASWKWIKRTNSLFWSAQRGHLLVCFILSNSGTHTHTHCLMTDDMTASSLYNTSYEHPTFKTNSMLQDNTSILIPDQKLICFNCFFKSFRDDNCLKYAGKLFHSLGAAPANARSPLDLRLRNIFCALATLWLMDMNISNVWRSCAMQRLNKITILKLIL